MSRLQQTLDMAAVQRLEWDPDEGPISFTRDEDAITDVEFHHTGGAGPRSLSFEEKQRWMKVIEWVHEKQNGWSDVFYHLFIFADGEIWIGRDLRRTSQANISDTITIHIPGMNPTMTEAQYAAALKLCRLWASSPDNIRDHQTRPAATQCAGPGVRSAITQLKKDYSMTTQMGDDLSGLQDAKEAKALGFWDGKRPRFLASRSTVAVIAMRAARYGASKGPRGPQGPRGLTGPTGPVGPQGPRGPVGEPTNEQIDRRISVMMPDIVKAVKAELVRDLGDDNA